MTCYEISLSSFLLMSDIDTIKISDRSSTCIHILFFFSIATVTERRLVGHRQEVCGLKWSPDNQYLASGGNDNRLYVWNMQSLSPVQTYTDHLAAVKAIAWSPHHHGLLASGGGTADRCIRFWNTLTGQPMQSVDTGKKIKKSFCTFGTNFDTISRDLKSKMS